MFPWEITLFSVIVVKFVLFLNYSLYFVGGRPVFGSGMKGIFIGLKPRLHAEFRQNRYNSFGREKLTNRHYVFMIDNN